MEDVLRKIYLKKHQQIQTRKVQRKIKGLEGMRRFKPSKNIWDDYRPLIQDFDLQKQLQMKKQIQYGNEFIRQKHRYKIKNILNPQSEYFLPSIFKKNGLNQKIDFLDLKKAEQIQQIYQRYKKSNPQRFRILKQQIQQRYRRLKLKRIFKKQVYSIIFINCLQKLTFKTLVLQRSITLNYEIKLPEIVDRIVNKYYCVILEDQILKYLELIKLKIKDPKVILQRFIINMLAFMSKILAQSTITKDLMIFFILISGQNSFFPDHFLTQLEASKLEFNEQRGTTENVSIQQTKMIIASGVGIKIFCLHILYRPWLLKIQRSPIQLEQIQKNYQNVRSIINGAGSIFYYIILQEYIQKLSPRTNPKSKQFKNLNIQLQSSLDIFPQNNKIPIIQKNNQMIPNQKRKLFESLAKQNSQMFAEIRRNIKIWLERIINACMNQNQKFLKNKKEYFKQNYQFIKIQKRKAQKLQKKKNFSRAQKTQKLQNSQNSQISSTTSVKSSTKRSTTKTITERESISQKSQSKKSESKRSNLQRTSKQLSKRSQSKKSRNQNQSQKSHVQRFKENQKSSRRSTFKKRKSKQYIQDVSRYSSHTSNSRN